MGNAELRPRAAQRGGALTKNGAELSRSAPRSANELQT
jgi:hypothetical protein